MDLSEHHAYFFGYGSLVNRDTHEFSAAHPAQLRGWRRIWRHTTLRNVAYLTVVPDETCQIDGLIAEVPGNNWAALDERERAYDRVHASHQISHPLDHDPGIAVYSIPDGMHRKPDETCAVLLSYLDVVVQGYLREFGEDGATRFFETTSGWDAPVINDRMNPLYPRHQQLSGDERACVDDHLRRLGVQFTSDQHARPDDGIWRDP